MTRVVDPLIADLQREHADAVRSGHVWKSRWIQLAGWLAFVKVLVICAAASLTSLEEWTPDDRKSLTRAAGISVVTAIVITVLLVSRSADDYPIVLLHPSPKRFLFLAPYPFVAGIVLGATLGIVLGLGGRALSRKLVGAAVGGALICSAIVFIDVGWVAPAAHIAYRMTVGGTDPTPSPGPGEQSLTALRRAIDLFSRDAAFAHFVPDALVFDYHRRLALSCSPLVFVLFTLALMGRFRRRWVLGIAASVAIVVWTWLVIVVTPWGIQWPAYAAAWLPNTTIAILTVVFGILSAGRRRAPRLRAF